MKTYLLPVALITTIVSIAIIADNRTDSNQNETNEIHDSVFLNGQKAYKLNISAEANPYFNNDYKSSLWLKGWMNEKEKDILRNKK